MRVWEKKCSLLLLFAILLLLPVFSAVSEDNGQISGMVWLDKTADGVIGGGEAGVSGVRISLERRDEQGQAQLVGTAATGKSGDFLFSALPDGDYRLKIEAPNDHQFTLHGQGSAALPAQGSVSCTPYFALQNGQRVIKDVGLTKSSSAVSVIAFEDENANGGRMQSEPLIRGVRVEVVYDYEGETYPVASAVSDREGQILIQRLSPGTYHALVTLPENFVVGPMGQKINTFYNCFYPNDDNTGYTLPFSLDVKESLGMGVGMVRTGALSGQIWYDANFNGKWDKDEGGLTEAEITLFSPSLALSRTTHADNAGTYTFRGLQPGDYQLKFTLPAGMIFTYPGTSLITETADQASVTVFVQVDVTASIGAVGAMPAAGLSLSLYEDANLNGRQDENEPPIPGATLTASQNGKAVESAVTDENGVAALDSLRGGETVLKLTLPEGYIFSGDLENLFMVLGAQSEAQSAVTLDGTQPDARFSAAATRPASISGMLFEDQDNSGIYQENSKLLSEFEVQAVSEYGEIAARATTDENGAYTLSPLVPGVYSVRFLLDDAYVASPYAEQAAAGANHILTQTPEYGETEQIALAPGQALAHMDGGVFQAGLVDGYVLVDEAYAQQTGAGLKGVSVSLLNADGTPASAYTYGETDEEGYYYIKGILPGTYTLLYTLPGNGAFTVPDTVNRQITSEAFTTESGSYIQMPHLRGIYTSALSGTVLHDGAGSNFSALLTLTGHNVPQTFEIHAQADGSYAFTDLRPDTYTLTVTLSDGLVFGQLEGSPIPATAGSRASAELTFAMGQDMLNADILASLPVSVSGTVYYDEDLSGAQEENEYGAESRSLYLWLNGAEAASAQTDENGLFVFSGLVPADYELRIPLDDNEVLLPVTGNERGGDGWAIPVSAREDASMILPIMRYASVSGAVWSLDGTLNGVNALAVTLLDSEGKTIAEKITDENGSFAFDTLLPGTYALSAVLPQGHLFARAQDTQERDSFIQSQPDGTVVSLPFSVPMGDDLSGIDIGMGAMGQIGDRAWLDENGNGMQDIGEPDMPGIVIELYQYGELIASTTTDEYGRYLLSDLHPGEYEMRVTMHPELKATVHQTEFPLVGSIMPESDELTVSFTGVVVPSGKANLHCDLGFQLRKKGQYPAAMDLIPQKDWRPYSER